MNAELNDFVIKQIGIAAEEVTEDALIEDDLGVDGDDATELLISYSKRFNVDISRFMAADYLVLKVMWNGFKAAASAP